MTGSHPRPAPEGGQGRAGDGLAEPPTSPWALGQASERGTHGRTREAGNRSRLAMLPSRRASVWRVLSGAAGVVKTGARGPVRTSQQVHGRRPEGTHPAETCGVSGAAGHRQGSRPHPPPTLGCVCRDTPVRCPREPRLPGAPAKEGGPRLGSGANPRGTAGRPGLCGNCRHCLRNVSVSLKAALKQVYS